jgi:hypothetical protein
LWDKYGINDLKGKVGRPACINVLYKKSIWLKTSEARNSNQKPLADTAPDNGAKMCVNCNNKKPDSQSFKEKFKWL